MKQPVQDCQGGGAHVPRGYSDTIFCIIVQRGHGSRDSHLVEPHRVRPGPYFATYETHHLCTGPARILAIPVTLQMKMIRR